MIEKNGLFRKNSNLNDKMFVFHDNLKKHLSTEYVNLSEQKDDLENELMLARVELTQKERNLFQNVTQKDVRRLFSPLQISNREEEEREEHQRHLTTAIEKKENEINEIQERMTAIKALLKSVDGLLDEVFSFEEDMRFLRKEKVRLENVSRETQEEKTRLEITLRETEEEKARLENVSRETQEEKIRLEITLRETEEEKARLENVSRETQEEKTRLEITLHEIEEEKARLENVSRETQEEKIRLEITLRETEEEKVRLENVSRETQEKKKRLIYPQLLRNLYELVDDYKERKESVDILLEFDDNNIELPVEINRGLIEQMYENIDSAISVYSASMILIQGEVKKEQIEIMLSYVADNRLIDTAKITYILQRV